MLEKLSKIALFFFVFVSVFSILALAIGYFFLNSAFLIIASALASFIIVKKSRFAEKTSLEVLALLFGMALLLAYPLLLIHPFFDASSDAATTINLRILKDKIPQNYLPYSGVSYSYQSASSILVKSIADFLPVLPDYIVYWIFGVLVGAFKVLAVYYFAKRFFKSEKTGLYSAILLFGTKMIFLNAYFGDHALTLGISIMLFAILSFHENSRLQFLFYPALLIIHPAAAMLFFISMIAYFLAFRQKFTQFAKLLPLTVLAIPSLFITYLPLAEQVFFGKGSNGFASLAELSSQALLIPLSIGLPIAILFIASGAWFFLRRQKIPKELLFCILSFALAVLVYFALSAKLVPFTGKFFELMTVSGIFCTAFFISNWAEKKKEKGRQIAVALFVLCIIGLFSSGQLNDLRNGTKINSAEFAFAQEFRNFDPELKKALFLTEHPSKIAEYSNKIPFDALSDYFLAANPKQVKNDSALEQALANQALNRKILSEKCIECLAGINTDYIVVEKAVFPELQGFEKTLESNGFIVYKK